MSELLKIYENVVRHEKEVVHMEEHVTEEVIQLSKPFEDKLSVDELETLQEKYDNLERMLTPEMQDVIKLQELISELEKQKSDILSEMDALNEKHQQAVSEHQAVLDELNSQIRSKKEEIISFDETILAQEFGLYSPRYDFINAEEYKENLDRIRNHQKQYIKMEPHLRETGTGLLTAT